MFTFGADPEFFLKLGHINVSAHDLVPGTKARTFKTLNGWVQADGTAIEFNTVPASSARAFAYNVGLAIRDVRAIVPSVFKFDIAPVVKFDTAYWRYVPKKAKELGCDPDYSAFREGRLNAAPHFDSFNETYRSGGGHLHIGWGENFDYADKSHKYDCILMINSLEAVISAYSKLWDHDKTRKEWYGGDGAFRPKSFGVEWRGLSNAWVSQPAIHGWLFNVSKAVYELCRKGKPPHQSIGNHPWECFDIMRSSYEDNEKIRRLNQYYDGMFPGDLPPLPPGSILPEAAIHTELLNGHR